MAFRYVVRSIKCVHVFPQGIFQNSRRHVLHLFAAKRNCSSACQTVFHRSFNVKQYGNLFVESYCLPVLVRHFEDGKHDVGISVTAESVEKIPTWKLRASDFGLIFHAELKQNIQNAYVKNMTKLKDFMILRQPCLLVEVPVHFDVSVKTHGNNDVTLSRLQSTKIDCSLQHGHLKTQNIKCEQLNVVSMGGDVHCQGSVLGNVNIRTAGEGSIRANRLQGSLVRLRSDEGQIKVDAVYAENSIVSSSKGSVLLTNLHGTTRVSLYQGDLKLVGLDGGLTATVMRGNADIKIARLLPSAHAAVIANDGNIVLRLADDLVAGLRLEGKDVKLQEAILGRKIVESDTDGIIFEGRLNTAEFMKDPLITAIAPLGEVTVEIQNWLPL